MTTLLTVLPLAVVMVAGPQIISAVLLSTSVDPRRNSLAFLAGVTLAVATGVTIAYWLARVLTSAADTSQDSTNDTIDVIVIVLLVLLAIRVFLRRENTEPPAWMKKLQGASPKFSFRLGLLLFVLMPTDIITEITVGAYLVRHDLAWWQGLPFIFVTVLLAAIPLLVLLLMGRRADVLLPRMRDWMTTNAWVVSELVIALFLVLTIA